MGKVWWESRVLWVNALVFALPFIPSVRVWIKQDPIHVMQYHAAYCFVMRLDTKDKIVLKKGDQA